MKSKNPTTKTKVTSSKKEIHTKPNKSAALSKPRSKEATTVSRNAGFAAKAPSRHNTPKANFQTELQISKAPKGNKKLEEQNEKVASKIKKQKDKDTTTNHKGSAVEKGKKSTAKRGSAGKIQPGEPDADADSDRNDPAEQKPKIPAQHQSRQPGKESKMRPKPNSTPNLNPSPDKLLEGKTAIITGGDSGIGKAVALLFAAHGANITVVYLDEAKDAQKTEKEMKKLGANSLFLSGDITKQKFCVSVIEQTLHHFSNIDILINNAAVQYPQKNPENINEEQLIKTFSTNIFAAFYLTIAALPYMKKGSCIINTTSVTAYRGSKHLVDYAATKGALVAFTRSLSTALIKRQIRVNAVAPGPVWTPLIPASFTKEKVEKFGQDVPMGRPGQPSEIAPCYLFLATNQASYMTGQVLHPNGGEIVNA